MKRAWIVALLLAGLGGTARAEQKIGFVNTEVILQEYKAVQAAMETFNRDVQAWEGDLQQRKKELDDLQRDVQHQSLMLSDQRRQDRESEYQRKLTEFEKFKESIWASDGLIEQRNEELLRPIISRVQVALEQLAAEEGFDLILDAADNNILYGDPAYDLTQRVLGVLNGASTTPGTETPRPGQAGESGETENQKRESSPGE
jgi:outer membrane protein